MSDTDEVTWLVRAEYARACLEYTFESNRNEERRIHILLVMTVAALGGEKYLLDEIANVTGQLHAVLYIVVMGSAAILLACLAYGIYGLTSKVFTGDSQMLPEWIGTTDPKAYLAQALNQDPEQVLRRIFIENHALAQAKNRRSKMHMHLSWMFLVGALPMIAVFAVMLF